MHKMIACWLQLMGVPFPLVSLRPWRSAGILGVGDPGSPLRGVRDDEVGCTVSGMTVWVARCSGWWAVFVMTGWVARRRGR